MRETVRLQEKRYRVHAFVNTTVEATSEQVVRERFARQGLEVGIITEVDPEDAPVTRTIR